MNQREKQIDTLLKERFMKQIYQITKEVCKNKISGVCDGCGGKLVPFKTVDNSGSPTYWAGCRHCSKFCWGVDKKVFKIARELVINRNWKAYSHMHEGEYKTDEEKDYYLCSQTAGVVRQVYDVITAGGFTLNK